MLELDVAATPPKKDVIMAQRMVKGESSSHKKEVKSPPGMLTCREIIKNDRGSNFLLTVLLALGRTSTVAEGAI